MLGIYKIESPSGRFYIGSSVNVRRRLLAHKRSLAAGDHINTALSNAAKKYGVSGLSFTEFACVLDGRCLRSVEQQVMDDLNPEYNISKNAECALFDDEVIKKRVKSKEKPIVRLEDGVVFRSASEAARSHGVDKVDNMYTAIKHKWKFAGHYWAYVGDGTTLNDCTDNSHKKEVARKYNSRIAAKKARSKPVKRLSDGALFPSAKAASLSFGRSPGEVSLAIQLNIVRGGSRWEYA